jgi:uncharacterized protein (TIGR02996 family)
MNQEQRALLAAIAKEPDDNLRRLVYADWLDEHCEPGKPGWPQNEHGMSAQAELIRVQIALLPDQVEPLSEDDRRRLEDRDRTLRQVALEALGPELYGLPDLSQRVSFDRGFLSLNLHEAPITALPDNFIVGGDLDLGGTYVRKLPENLTVGGNLNLSWLPITTLPDNLTVNGNLDLGGTYVRNLPENLTVGQSLSLWGTEIIVLPENLTVGGNLNLSWLPITTLPDNLTVNGDLYLIRTLVSALPCSASTISPH